MVLIVIALVINNEHFHLTRHSPKAERSKFMTSRSRICANHLECVRHTERKNPFGVYRARVEKRSQQKFISHASMHQFISPVLMVRIIKTNVARKKGPIHPTCPCVRCVQPKIVSGREHTALKHTACLYDCMDLWRKHVRST